MNRIDELQTCRDNIIERVRKHLEQARQHARNRAAPVTTLTYAQSIDGCIAPPAGGTLQLSNLQSQKLTHQVRSLHDAILIGVNTVLIDDPQLTVRLVKGRNPQPVVVDSRLRFPFEARLLSDPCVRPIIMCGNHACHKKEQELIRAGARIIRTPLKEDGAIDLPRAMVRLKQLGFHSVMVEGGARIISSVLACQIADLLMLTICPRFVGGLAAVKPLCCHSHARMPELGKLHYQSLAGDLIVCGVFENPGNGFGDVRCNHEAAAEPMKGIRQAD